MYILRSLSTVISESFLQSSVESRLLELDCFKHALSTPLTVLLSLAEERAAHEVTDLPRYKQAVKTLKHLCGNFTLDIKENCEVGQLLEEVKLLLQNGHHRVELHALTDGSAVLVGIHRDRLKEAMLCLIKNGLEAAPEAEKSVLVAYTETSNTLKLHIKDFGCGLSWWKTWMVQMPFVSFRSSGNGIGLYFARKVIVDELGGSMKMFSSPGWGTAIECSIPKYR